MKTIGSCLHARHSSVRARRCNPTRFASVVAQDCPGKTLKSRACCIRLCYKVCNAHSFFSFSCVASMFASFVSFRPMLCKSSVFSWPCVGDLALYSLPGRPCTGASIAIIASGHGPWAVAVELLASRKLDVSPSEAGWCPGGSAQISNKNSFA